MLSDDFDNFFDVWDLGSELSCEEQQLAALDAVPTAHQTRRVERAAATRRRNRHKETR